MSSRRGTPLRSIVDLAMGVGSAFIAYISILLGETVDETKDITLETISTTSELVSRSVKSTSEIVSKSVETTSDMFSKITQYTGLSSVYYLLTKIIELIAKVPELIVGLIKNAIVFLYIFCVLILVGQFDWLLNDVYTLTAISLLLTYLTYR